MVAAIAVLSALLVTGASVRVVAADWPQWRGPDRTDVTSESSGWPAGWPPKRLWGKNVGYGCTSPIIVDGRLYVMGWHGEQRRRNPVGTDTVYCFEVATGKLRWKQSYPCRYQGRFRVGDTSLYGGPTSTPTFDTSSRYLYTLSTDGDLRCWNTSEAGTPVWSVNLYEKYTVSQRPKVKTGLRDYGYCCSPIVLADTVVTEVGGPAGTLVALDKKTGAEVWRSASQEPASHNAGPVPITVAGIPCLASFGIRRLAVIRTDGDHAGETLAEYPWLTAFACNIITPAVAGDKLILSSGHDVRRTALVQVSAGKAKPLWKSRYWSEGCSPVISSGRMYLVIGQVHCIDLSDGRIRWRGGSFGRESSCLLTADDKLLVLGSGHLGLVEAAPETDAYRELARLKNVIGGTCYPHVALADGIVAVKNSDGGIVCLSVRAR